MVGVVVATYTAERLHGESGHPGLVAMVISTMHEKSCIDSHNARKFEKISKIQSFTHLAITVMKLRKYHNHEFLKLS